LSRLWTTLPSAAPALVRISCFVDPPVSGRPMSIDPRAFADQVGAELTQHLGARSRAELLALPQEAQFSAALGASLLCVAEVLRVPVERGVPPERLVAICARQLEQLLAALQPPDRRPR
jgi:hypothetical protein